MQDPVPDRIPLAGRPCEPELGRASRARAPRPSELNAVQGTVTASRASGFGREVLAYEPYPDHALCERWNVELVELNESFRRSDSVTLHTPGEGDNRQLVNRGRLAMMKPRAVLIDTARGVLVDEDALYEALTGARTPAPGSTSARRSHRRTTASRLSTTWCSRPTRPARPTTRRRSAV